MNYITILKLQKKIRIFVYAKLYSGLIEALHQKHGEHPL